MALIEILMPQMGESVMEATIISWLKKEGEKVEMEEPLLEVATDKVDTEVPSNQEGIIKEFLAQEGDIVKIGSPIAILSTDISEMIIPQRETPVFAKTPEPVKAETKPRNNASTIPQPVIQPVTNRFYSPLVKNMVKEEGILLEDLERLQGTGKDGRVTKNDIIAYLSNKKQMQKPSATNGSQQSAYSGSIKTVIPPPIVGEEDEVIEMDRVRRIISDRMLESRRVSAHVHSFVEADVTKLVKWKEKVQENFQREFGVKLTYTPIIVEALAKAICDFPMINISVDGYKIIKKKHINIGIAVVLPNGNLIVPVIKDADKLDLVTLTKMVTDLAIRARSNQLTLDEISGSTYTLTNVGSFGSTMGTPIILQPNVAILAIGAIEKKPTVVETEEYGDIIAIRQRMTLSHSYDHRVIDGALGSMFVKRVSDYLEKFDDTRLV
ncbi:MAG: dihydrolipoamide acetyltransferase family protein [Cyclobacteriaceae bacterium]|nr:dihydrolipoamide acetyltransferase family protein [Cyclobacteriaceae bacterium]